MEGHIHYMDDDEGMMNDWNKNSLLSYVPFNVPMIRRSEGLEDISEDKLQKNVKPDIYTPKLSQQTSKPKSSSEFLGVSVTLRLFPLDFGWFFWNPTVGLLSSFWTKI